MAQRRKRKNCVTVIGKEKSNSLEGVVPFVRDFWDLSVSRLSPSSTADQLAFYLQESHIDVKEVYIFDSKIKGTKSAKVRISIEHKENAKDEAIWPEHIRVQDWMYKPKTERSKRSPSSEQKQ